MKSYRALKWIQGIFIVFFFMAFCILLRAEHFLSTEYSIFLFSGLFGCLAFLAFDLISWNRQNKKEQRLFQLAQTDALTRLPNTSALKNELVKLSETVLEDDISCAVISFDNIHRLNRTYGHEAGDAVFREFADILRVSAEDLCFIGRKSGRTFLAIFRENSHEKTELFLERLKRGVEIHNETNGLLPITYHAEAAYNDELHYVSIYDLIKIRSGKRRQQA